MHKTFSTSVRTPEVETDLREPYRLRLSKETWKMSRPSTPEVAAPAFQAGTEKEVLCCFPPSPKVGPETETLPVFAEFPLDPMALPNASTAAVPTQEASSSSTAVVEKKRRVQLPDSDDLPRRETSGPRRPGTPHPSGKTPSVYVKGGLRAHMDKLRGKVGEDEPRRPSVPVGPVAEGDGTMGLSGFLSRAMNLGQKQVLNPRVAMADGRLISRPIPLRSTGGEMSQAPTTPVRPTYPPRTPTGAPRKPHSSGPPESPTSPSPMAPMGRLQLCPAHSNEAQPFDCDICREIVLDSLRDGRIEEYAKRANDGAAEEEEEDDDDFSPIAAVQALCFCKHFPSVEGCLTCQARENLLPVLGGTHWI